MREVLSDDLNDMIIDEVKATQKNKTGEALKKEVRKNAKKHIIEIFKSLESELAKSESDPQKLEQDRLKREQVQAATQKAREEKGA